MLNGVLYNEYGHQNSTTVKPTSSSSSSSSESQSEALTLNIGQNILNIAGVSEGQDLFPASNQAVQGMNSSSKSSHSSQMNYISQVYQNFPRNLSTRYSMQKSSISCQSNSAHDCSCSVYENVGNSNANYEHIASLRNGQNFKFHCQKIHPSIGNSNAFCVKHPKFIKHCFRGKDLSCADKQQISSDFEKSLLGASNSNRIPLSPELQHLSARTIAGLYAVGLYHDLLPPDVTSCDPSPLTFSSGVKYPSHLLGSPHDSVFEVYHPFDLIHRRNTASVYGANDVIFDPTSAFFSVPPSFIGMRPLR